MHKPKLTTKEAKFVAGIAKGKTQRKAYIDAYNTKGHIPTVDAEASKTINKPQVQEALEPIFRKHNISLETAIAPIGKALTATKVVIHGNKEDAFAEVVEDLDMQLKGSDRALKLMGIGQDKTGETINNFGNMIVSKGDKYAE